MVNFNQMYFDFVDEKGLVPTRLLLNNGDFKTLVDQIERVYGYFQVFVVEGDTRFE